MQIRQDLCRKGTQRGPPQPKELNHGFHGFRILHPCRPGMKSAQKQTKTTKKNSSFVSFVSFCSRQIRVIREIREIRGKIFANRSDFGVLQDKERIDRSFSCFSLRSLRSFAAMQLWLRRADAGVFFRFTMVVQDAQVANEQGFANIFKNPRFSLDLSRLYAKIVLVKIGSIEADGSGTKAGFRSAGGLVFPAAPLHSRPGPGKSAAFCRKPLQRSNVAADGKNSEVDHREIREIRENRGASVRVFRVFRGEDAPFLSLLSLLAAKSMEAPVQESLTLESGVFRGRIQSNPVKPSQTIFLL